MKSYRRWCSEMLSMFWKGFLGSLTCALLPTTPLHAAESTDGPIPAPASPSTPSSPFSRPPAPDLSNSITLARQLNQAFASVASRCTPWVVVLNVATKSASLDLDSPTDIPSNPESATGSSSPHSKTPPTPSPEIDRDRDRKGHPGPNPLPPSLVYDSQGSGIIWNEEGYILTNGHVIDDAADIQVRLADGREFPARVHARDYPSDLALLKINASQLTKAVLGDSTQVRVGEFAIAIGAPFDLDYSITVGHISAKGRANVLEDRTLDQDFIQTDAQINPGNSGGPLLNLEGEVIGINTLIRGLHTGIGFAIPINQVRQVAQELVERGYYPRNWIGLGVRSLKENPVLRGAFPEVSHGLVIKSIEPRGPAHKSELRAGDVILSADGKPLVTANDLKRHLREKRLGDSIQLEVLREKQNLQIRLNTELMPSPVTQTAQVTRPWWEDPDANLHDLGIGVKALTAEAAEREGSPRNQGVTVASIQPGSIAEQLGIRVGVVITELDRRPVISPRQFRDLISGIDLRRGATLHFYSEGTARFEFIRVDGH